VDVLADNEIPLILYRKEFSRYQSLKRDLKELTEKSRQNRQEEDYIRFQLEQLHEARLTDGEQEMLEQEQETLRMPKRSRAPCIKLQNYFRATNRVGCCR
jgi:DNA repair protein RecN (Recombination protein N)